MSFRLKLAVEHESESHEAMRNGSMDFLSLALLPAIDRFLREVGGSWKQVFCSPQSVSIRFEQKLIVAVSAQKRPFGVVRGAASCEKRAR